MNHKQLCEIGAKLLKKSGFSVIAEEFVSMASESPDILAWKNGSCVMIEVKVSLSDFKADAKKYTRRSEKHGVGNYRYYLAPKGLINKDKIPKGWGFIEIDNNNNKCEFTIGESLKYHSSNGEVEYKKSNIQTENLHLLSIIRKMNNTQIKNCNYRVYILDSEEE